MRGLKERKKIWRIFDRGIAVNVLGEKELWDIKGAPYKDLDEGGIADKPKLDRISFDDLLLIVYRVVTVSRKHPQPPNKSPGILA